ncbi:MAG TPA: ROK family protein [Candidatus Limnocylindrales bacterium]|jgi:polyphosphate glucokinase
MVGPLGEPGALPSSGSGQGSDRPLAIGIDIGGTGVKAGVVDVDAGELISPRIRRPTPQPSVPDAVIAVVADVLDELTRGGWATPSMPAGCGLPGVVKAGQLKTAANIDQGWVDAPVQQLLADRLGRPLVIGNDADVAGIAELGFGAARGQPGTVLMLTLGTGIGSALFVDGMLVPNTEFGHLQFHGKDAEKLLSATARERRGLSWKRWAKDFNQYLAQCELYFGPDLIILGGGGSKVYAKYKAYLSTRAPIVTARLLNSAGIVGAAVLGRTAASEGTASLPAADRRPIEATTSEAAASTS